MSAEEDAGEAEAAQGFDRGAEAGLVLLRAVARRTVGAKLAKGQVTAENGESRLAEGFSEGDEERCLAVGSGAVRENEALFRRCGVMEEAADRRGGIVLKCGGGR